MYIASYKELMKIHFKFNNQKRTGTAIPQKQNIMTLKKDTQGLYLNGKLKADNYTDAIKELYRIDQIPKGFCIDEDYQADGYSVVDSNGVQHIYELSPKEFYENLQDLEDFVKKLSQ